MKLFIFAGRVLIVLIPIALAGWGAWMFYRYLHLSPLERQLKRREREIRAEERRLEVERQRAALEARAMALEQVRAELDQQRAQLQQTEYERLMRELDRIQTEVPTGALAPGALASGVQPANALREAASKGR